MLADRYSYTRGDDHLYLYVYLPSGGQLTLRYPDEKDVQEVEAMVDAANEVKEQQQDQWPRGVDDYGDST